MLSNKAISSVVAIGLLLITTVAAAVGFQIWFNTYSSSVLVDVEEKERVTEGIRIERLSGNYLYVYSDIDTLLTTLKISDDSGNELCDYLPDAGNATLTERWDFENHNSSHVFGSQNGLNLSFNGVSSLSSGILGRGVSIPGSGNLGLVDSETGGSLDFGMTDDFTLSVWFRTADDDFAVQSLIDKKDNFGTAIAGYYLVLETSGYVIAGISDLSSLVTNPPGAGFTSRHDDIWHHAVAVFDRSGNSTVYVDGVFQSTRDISSVGDISNSRTFHIGEVAGGNFFNGSLDEIRIYNMTLSQDQIRNIYHFNSPFISLSEGINKIGIAGCNLTHEEKYEILLFTNTSSASSELVAK